MLLLPIFGLRIGKGNNVLNTNGNYTCHHCGTPDSLIIGTLNKANRLQPWCTHCTFVKMGILVPRLPSQLHVPKHVVDSVKDVIKNCKHITASCSDAQKKSFMAAISCSWNKEDEFYQIVRGCGKGCPGCAHVSQMITVWAPEVPKEDLWYGDFSNVTGDITREINPQLLEEEKAEPESMRWRCDHDESIQNTNDSGDDDDSDSDKTIPLPRALDPTINH